MNDNYMEDEIITYSLLRELQRKEKIDSNLQKLEKDFLQNVSSYINKKINLLKDADKTENRFSVEMLNKIAGELQNARRIIQDIYDRRESKIISQALIAIRSKGYIDTSNMLPHEERLFNELTELIQKYRQQILRNLLLGELSPQKKDPKEFQHKLIKIIKDVPQFMWEDEKVYGPFSKENVANLPKKLANFLIEKNFAKPL